MDQLFENAFKLIGTIALGYILKRIGFFKEEDTKAVTKIVMNIAIPGVIITNFSSASIEPSYMIVLLFGLLCNLAGTFTGRLFTGKEEPRDRAFYMLTVPGYNISSFTLPFAQSMLGAAGVVPVCLFDIGNSVMTLGGNYAITSVCTNSGEGAGLKEIAGRILRSVPLLTCAAMLILSFLNIRLPEMILSAASFAGSAGGLLVMLSLGMMLELSTDKTIILAAFKALGLRYAFSITMAAVIFFLTPFEAEIKQTVIFCLFAPVSSVSNIFISKANGNTQAGSLANSMSILLSSVTLTAVLMLFKG
jgi:predicted permease